MRETPPNPFDRETIPSERLAAWRDLITLMARVLELPVTLVMRVDGPEIEVFLSSATQGNPYDEGDREAYVGSGLYCEWVVQNEQLLQVPDALADPKWATNPDVKLGMISYVGVPILRPDGKVFGTLCALDSAPNAYSDDTRALVAQCRDMIQRDLELELAHERVQRLERELTELQQVLPICMHCKRVRDSAGDWRPVEKVLTGLLGTRTSHGYCPICYEHARREIEG